MHESSFMCSGLTTFEMPAPPLTCGHFNQVFLQWADNGHKDTVKFLTLELHCDPTVRNTNNATDLASLHSHGTPPSWVQSTGCTVSPSVNSPSPSLEIQHCATSSQTSRLSFARCSQNSLPFNFDILEGGDFSPDAYGNIQLRSFSLIIVLKRLLQSFTWFLGADDVKYRARVYYLWRRENRKEIHFVITKDLQAHAMVCLKVSIQFIYVAVLGRNRTLFCCVFWLHYHVQSAVARNFR